MKKVLNLYAGIGGNRKLWEDVEVTAVELDPKIAEIYQDFFPDDKIIVADAHQYLLEHIKDDWDFIWSSPPCPSHGSIRNDLGCSTGQCEPIYPDMKLYEEIILLQKFAKCKFAVENVIPYYEPLIKPQKSGRHCFWSNFYISDIAIPPSEIEKGTYEIWAKNTGFDLSKYKNIDKRKAWRNCVNSKLGLHIFNSAFKHQQQTFKGVDYQ